MTTATEDRFRNIAAGWDAILSCEDITPEQVALSLAWAEMVEAAHNPFDEQNYAQAVEYIQIAAEIVNPVQTTRHNPAR